MDARTAEVERLVDRLASLADSDDAIALHALALEAEAVVDARASDTFNGLALVDPTLLTDLSGRADEALGRAAGLGHPEAAAEVAWRIYCAGQEDRAAEAFALLGHASDLPNGQYLLGLFRFAGFGCPVDPGASAAHHRSAAAAGMADAMFELYVYASRGIGGPIDDRSALDWCTRAAEAGSARAMANLGGFYATGHQVPRDEVQALRWYQLAAESGHGRAAATVGVMLATGQGTEPDEDAAREWFTAAGDLGYDPTALMVQCGIDPARFLEG
ncbi:MAG: tetratricopeptide repeat protein [Myxococcota bacterium]